MAQAEYEAQGTESIGGTAGRVVLLPTIVINNKQYRGRLDTVSVTKALCAGFDETTEPEVSHCMKEISVVVCYHLRCTALDLQWFLVHGSTHVQSVLSFSVCC